MPESDPLPETEPETEPELQPESNPVFEPELDDVDIQLSNMANSVEFAEDPDLLLSNAYELINQEENEKAEAEKNIEENIIEPTEEKAETSETVSSESLELQNQVDSKEEPIMEITNDMFDIGYDLDDEPQYSDENIDLSAFRGSIKDAEEINKVQSDALDLDAAEAGSSTTDIDMSNLVAAAMNTLVHHEEEVESEEAETEEAEAEEAEAEKVIQVDPSKLEKATLDFSENDDESPDSTLDFGEEEDEELSNLDFSDEEENNEANLDYDGQNEFNPEANLDFTEEEQEDSNSNLDYRAETDNYRAVTEITESPEVEPQDSEETVDAESVVPEEESMEPEVFVPEEESVEPEVFVPEEESVEPETFVPAEEESVEPDAFVPAEEETSVELDAFVPAEEEPVEVDAFVPEEDESSLEEAIQNLIPPMDDSLSHQLDEVITDTQNEAIETTDEEDTPAEHPEEPTDAIPEINASHEEEETSPENEVPFTLHFEPVNPEQNSSLTEEMNDFDDLSSLIIEDYNEVPTVSNLEKELKKQEKEKRKNRKKNAKKKKEEGFALSLEDVDSENSTEDSEKFKYSSSMPIRSTNMPEVPKPKEEPAKEPEPEKFKYSSSMPIRSTNMPEVPKPKEEPAKEPEPMVESTDKNISEDIETIQPISSEVLEKDKLEAEHPEDIHKTNGSRQVVAEKTIYDNGTVQREYYQLYFK